MKKITIVFALLVSFLAPAAAKAQDHLSATQKLLSAVERARLFADKDKADWAAYVDAKCSAFKRVVEDKQDLAKFICPEGIKVINVVSGVVTEERKARVKAKLLKWGSAVAAAVAAILLSR